MTGGKGECKVGTDGIDKKVDIGWFLDGDNRVR